MHNQHYRVAAGFVLTLVPRLRPGIVDPIRPKAAPGAIGPIPPQSAHSGRSGSISPLCHNARGPPGRTPGRPCTSDKSGAVETDPGSPSEAIGRPVDRIRIGIATDSNTQNGLFHIHKAENKRRAILQDGPRISGPGTRTGSDRSGSHRTAGVAVGNRAVPLAHGGAARCRDP